MAISVHWAERRMCETLRVDALKRQRDEVRVGSGCLPYHRQGPGTPSQNVSLFKPRHKMLQFVAFYSNGVYRLFYFKMSNVKTIIVAKMTSHCAGTVQEESESGIRK